MNTSNQPDSQAGDEQLGELVELIRRGAYYDAGKRSPYLENRLSREDGEKAIADYAERLATERAIAEAKLARKQFTEALNDGDFIIANGERITALAATLTKGDV
jgi:hypothetical protein